MSFRFKLSAPLLILTTACGGLTPAGEEEVKETVALNNTLTQVTALESEADCPNGGGTLEHGIDVDGDATLSEDEITHTYVICHGTNGQDADVSDLTSELEALRGELEALKTAVDLNTAKEGLTEAQATQLAANTAALNDIGNHTAFDGWDKSVADDSAYLTEETDPVASAAGYLTSYTETDPVASAAGYLTEESDPLATTALIDLGNNAAFDGWDKDVSDDVSGTSGLTSEQAADLDQVPLIESRLSILAGDMYSNYDSADFDWELLREFNYLVTETDPVASAAGYLTEETDPVASAAGYLTSYTETDPVASAAGYLTSYTETDPVASAAGYLTSYTETDPVASAAGYLTSYTETDPVASAALTDLGNNAAFNGWDKDASDDVAAYDYDYDDDGIDDIEDNCPAVSNPNQEDKDRDNTGDACDVYLPAVLSSNDNALMFTRCPAGLDFLPDFNSCRDWYEQEGGLSASTFDYCEQSDNDCNGGSGGTKLNGSPIGASELFTVCDDLQLEGYDDWRVPTKDEMSIWASDIPALTGASATYRFWTSESYDEFSAWAWDNNAGGFTSWPKAGDSLSTYCVRGLTP